jgi:hypothetical protein
VSKRSFRRLAVVAGAALAAGSMTPAMAAITVGGAGAGAATAAVTVPALPSAGTLVPTGLLTGAGTFAFSSVEQAGALAFTQVNGLRTDVSSIVGDLLGAATGVTASVNAGATASTGGINVAGLGGVSGTGDLLGVLPQPGDILDGAQGTVGDVTDLGVGTAFGAVGLVMGQNGVLSTAGGLVGTGLGVVNGLGVSANASAVAGLIGSL